jgi:hypothetical protein
VRFQNTQFNRRRGGNGRYQLTPLGGRVNAPKIDRGEFQLGLFRYRVHCAISQVVGGAVVTVVTSPMEGREASADWHNFGNTHLRDESATA